MRLKHFALLFLLVAAGVAGRTSYADTLPTTTLTLAAVGNQSMGNAAVYPYYFKVGNASTLTPLMCVSLQNYNSIGQSWVASMQGIDDSTADTSYREEAWIFSQLGKVNPATNQAYTNQEVQLAAWAIGDAYGAHTEFYNYIDANAIALYNNAPAMAANVNLYNSGFYSSFTIYTPVSLTSATEPQTFLGDPPAPTVTPEPSSLLLLGTGLLAGATMILRRRTSIAASDLF